MRACVCCSERYCVKGLKVPIKSRFGNTYDGVLGISSYTNICPAMCTPFICSERWIYTFGWLGLTIQGDDGRGWPTTVPQEIPHFSCKMSAIFRHMIAFSF